jgi:hypothetical protein
MLRIVGVRRSRDVDQEFVLLQNHGALRAILRGHILVAESALMRDDLSLAYAFQDEEAIPAGLYVMLSSGRGLSRWGRTKDGAHVYHAYMGRSCPLWAQCEGPIHLLGTQHSYLERCEPVLLI